MSLSPSSSARPATTPMPPAAAPGAGQAVAAQYASASGNVAARLPTVDPVALQDDLVSISRQGLQAPTGPARSTSESAQSLMNTFAQRLFGEDAATAKVAYNLASFSGAISDAARLDDSGVARAGTFALEQRASFIGTGQIDTEDGRSFDFELKVKYEPKTAETETRLLRERPVLETPDVLVLTGKPLPEIKFPGSLDDLFKLLSRELRTEVSSSSGGAGSGDLTLRLMRLVDRAALLAPRPRSDEPEANSTDRASAVANTVASTYGSAPPSRSLT